MASPSLTSTPAASSPRSPRLLFVAVLIALSGLYFADTLLRATLKTFWFDELNTIYLCRLPSFATTWHAVLSGGDFNPPLLYLLTRLSQSLAGGEGLIASRMPAILGFWVFGLCLYRFTARRLGALPGIIAALLPWFTLAHYYAYEARAHGPLLGWCGLMLVCWQQSQDSANRDAPTRSRALWPLLLALCWLGALLTHVYAVFLLVPFALVECDRLLRHRRVQLAVVAALVVPALLVAPLYLRMARGYRASITTAGIHIHPYEVAQHSLVTVFGPALLLLLLTIALLAVLRAAPSAATARALSREERVLAIGLLVLPLVGVVLVRLSHGPYFERYFIASTAGLALLLAQLAARPGRDRRIPRILLATMLTLVAADTLIAAWCHRHLADIDLIEPSSLLHFSPSPAQPLYRRDTLLSQQVRNSHGDVLITGHPDYLYLQYYAPDWLRSRLLFVETDPTDSFLVGYHRFGQLTGIDLRTALLPDYLAHHADFLVYEVPGNGCPHCDELFLKSGYRLLSVRIDQDGRLEHYSR